MDERLSREAHSPIDKFTSRILAVAVLVFGIQTIPYLVAVEEAVEDTARALSSISIHEFENFSNSDTQLIETPQP